MDRLTERADGSPDDVYVKQHDYIAASHKLAEYEDTGLTPDEVMRLAQGKLIYESYQGGKLDEADQYIEMLEKMVEGYVKKYEDMSRGISHNRLHEICEAEKDGRLVVLPCKVGEEIFYHEKDCDYCDNRDERMCEKHHNDETYVKNYCSLVTEKAKVRSIDTWVNTNGPVVIQLKNFGESVFLTEEAAESALKAREGK